MSTIARVEKAISNLEATKHFNGIVPQALRDKMLEVATAIKEEFISDCGSEACACPNMREIYGYHVSGFIPSQLGGFEISELYRSDIDSSYHFTKAQSEAMEKQNSDMYKAFYRDHKLGEHNRREGDAKLDENFAWDDLPEKLQNTFSDYENEWFEPALLRVEMWIDDTARKHIIGLDDDAECESILIQAGLGYRDQPYYRAKYDESLFEIKYSMAEFMAMSADDVVQALQAKMKDVK